MNLVTKENLEKQKHVKKTIKSTPAVIVHLRFITKGKQHEAKFNTAQSTIEPQNDTFTPTYYYGQVSEILLLIQLAVSKLNGKTDARLGNLSLKLLVH